MRSLTRPTNGRVKRRFVAFIIGTALASYVAGRWDWCKEWIAPSWAYLWKLPVFYVVATIAYWFIVFGLLYNEDKDASGDGAIGLFFLPLIPVIHLWTFIKDAIREAKIEGRILYVENTRKKDPPS